MDVIDYRWPVVVNRDSNIHRWHTNTPSATVATPAQGIPGQSPFQRSPGQTVNKVQVVVVHVVGVVHDVIRLLVGVIVGDVWWDKAH